MNALHILVGCYNHYFVLYLKGKNIYLLDSLNTPLPDVMNGTVSVPNPTDLDKGRFRDMKTAIEIV